MMMVRPLLDSPRSTSKTSVVSCEDNPEVGSSRNSSVGSVTSSWARLTRLRWPPESTLSSTVPMRLVFCSVSLSSLSTRSTRCSISSSLVSGGSRSFAV